MFVYFSFNNCHVGYFDEVAIEQFTKFMTWRKVLSYKIQKIISDFILTLPINGGLSKITIRFFFRLLLLAFSFEA